MMRFSWNTRVVISASLCVSLLLFPCTPSFADEPAGLAPVGVTVFDVELAPDGILHGTLADASGAPRPNQRVALRSGDQSEIAVVSDENGHFQVPLGRGGTYQLLADDVIVHARCWSHGAAPPHAIKSVIVSDQVVRAQVSPSCCGLNNPWVVAGLVAVAIAVPIALYQNRNDRDDASN